jgi:hypothetical protein
MLVCRFLYSSCCRSCCVVAINRRPAVATNLSSFVFLLDRITSACTDNISCHTVGLMKLPLPMQLQFMLDRIFAHVGCWPAIDSLDATVGEALAQGLLLPVDLQHSKSSASLYCFFMGLQYSQYPWRPSVWLVLVPLLGLSVTDSIACIAARSWVEGYTVAPAL